MRVLRRRDQGQAVVLLLACVVVAVITMVAVVRLGARMVLREHAQAAADAAALAGVVGGRPAAARLAAANHGVLLSFRVVADPMDASAAATVEVMVRVGGAVATARATRAP